MKLKKLVISIVISLIFINSQTIIAQETNKITIQFENKTLKEVLAKLDKKVDQKFFFLDNWLGDATFTKDYKSISLEDILTDLLENTSINFFVYGDRIVLTKNNTIHADLPINYFKNNPKKSETETKNPIFQKKYIVNNNQGEGSIITIGKENRKSQKSKYTITGNIVSASSKKPISNLKVSIANRNITTYTNDKGFYSISVPLGLNIFNTKVQGYQDLQEKVVVYGNGTLNIEVSESVERLGEVVIMSSKDDNIRKAVVGITKIDIKGIKNIPLVLGEQDLLKVATTMPGVKTAGEGALGYNVRGGKSDQNLILLDNAVMYNPSHFFGVFSAINPFSTGDVEIYKGSIPTEFGGRLSSVIDISTKEIEKSKFSGQGNIGPVTGNLTLEIPIAKEKTSLLVGARSTYSNWILKKIPDESIKNSEASFYDGIFRFESELNKKNKLKATAYYSNDQFSISSDSIYKYNNRLASLEWNHTFNSKNKSSFQVNNSQYKFQITYDGNLNKNFDLNFTINETQLKYKLKHILSKKHQLDYGVSSKLYAIDPGEIKPLDIESVIEPKFIDSEKALESAIFVSDQFKVSDKLLLNLGLRYSYYVSLGEATQNIYAENLPISDETVLETIHYNNNEVIKTYHAPEIRSSLRYFLSPSFSLKASYNNTLQYAHMLSSNTTASPIDTWKLSDLNTKPQKSDQYSVGFFKNFDDNEYELSLEGYYKEMRDILDFKVGANLLLNENIETELLNGEGKAYGVEFLVKKKKGRLNGWLGYSYSRSLIKLDSEFLTEQINNGNFFPTNYDKPHDLSLIVNYKLTKRYSFSSNFIYQTGRPITYPIGKYEYGGIEHVLYSERNQYRIPDYYRFDFGINIEGNHKIQKLAHSFWNISVYNVLGRNNPYSVFFVNDDGYIKAYKTSIFAIPIPTITYNFKF